TSTIVARDPKTGSVRWAVQLTPGDRWGFDATNENILADLTVEGQTVKALVHFDRNGFAYTIDRVTGRILVAEKYGPANWASRVDLQTGQPAIDSAFAPATGRAVVGVCPSAMGMKTFQPAAFSPVTGLFYVPATNLCMNITPVPTGFTPGKPFLGATIEVTPGPGRNRGRFLAWDATTGTIAWEARETYPVLSGALVTAGGVVFYGTLDGWFKALDATTGRELWRFKTPSGIVGNPISFSGPDGRQYVAIVSGLGGPLAGLGGGVVGLDRVTKPGGVLLVFAF
ncbi:MAG: PQQ-dependent dehydrogenase, methanol/ethanol family, partial [Gemmatimonadales bacterium]